MGNILRRSGRDELMYIHRDHKQLTTHTKNIIGDNGQTGLRDEFRAHHDKKHHDERRGHPAPLAETSQNTPAQQDTSKDTAEVAKPVASENAGKAA